MVSSSRRNRQERDCALARRVFLRCNNQVSVHSEESWLRFQDSRNSHEPLPKLRIVPPFIKTIDEPSGAFNPINAIDCKSGLGGLISQLVRVMKEGIHKVLGMPRGIAMLAVLKILIHDACEMGV